VTLAMPAGGLVTEADLDGLPAAAVHYLRFTDVVGKARTGSLLAAAHGRFRMPGRTLDGVPRLAAQHRGPRAGFHMHLRVAPGVAMTGWDTYADGGGLMRGKLFGALPVASGAGPHFTTGELVTWLNDAVLLAPSMLLDPAVQLREDQDDDGFRVELTDGGRSVAARVLVDDDGAPRDFWTDDRYADLPGGLVRCRWRTPVDGWTVLDGRPTPVGAKAVWQLTGGPFTYAELEFDEVVLDPAALPR
jgi:hypothetical protein